MSKKQIWTLETDENNLGWLHIDVPNRGANTLSHQALLDFDNQLGEIEKRVEKKEIEGLVILSDKPAGFIAGADVSEFTTITTEQEAEEVIQQAHDIFARLESLKVPTLALIHGHCLGGGLELALSCDYRVAERSASLGFPEVMLGIFPGFGGSVRSIRLIGVQHAMTMMLTGRPVPARKAKKTGLVDEVVAERQLKRAASAILLKARGKKDRKTSILNKVLNSGVGRMALAYWLRKQTAKKVSAKHYPAPFALIDLWEKWGGSYAQMFKHEVKTVAKLLVLPQTQNLIRLFFLQERLKGLGKSSAQKAEHIHVIGAGVMGGDIAAWCALQGMNVTLQDQNINIVAAAIKRAAQLYDRKLYTPRDKQAAMDRLQPDMEGLGVSHADIVLEAIVENLEIKQSLYKAIEPKMKQGAVLATNTSGIPIDELATVLEMPERLIGIHFFNPVAQMKLVETIAGKATSQQTVDVAHAFVTQIRKLPLPVKSSPGFLVNRILMPYLMEAVTMVEEGKSPESIDKSALDFGMPMGPVALADKVGLDVCLAVAQDLSATTGDEVPDFLKQWVKEGRLGVKSGHGFYTYEKGKAVHAKDAVQSGQADITERLVMRIVNEAKLCLEEGVVADADLLDAGMVFGTGFAPFRGGVMRYASEEGIL